MDLLTNPTELRARFEALHTPGSFGFKRSHKGNYINPALSRDWKWFQLGYLQGQRGLPSKAANKETAS